MLGLTVAALTAAAIINGANPNATLGFYPHCGVVTEVNECNDTVTVTDFNGFEWAFVGIEDWCVNDICSMQMCDNGTEIITDDIICFAQYEGYITKQGE